MKYEPNPRGKLWTEDKSKFGQRMLEKMGWSSGKGLGVDESGVTEPVDVRFKNDKKGFGQNNPCEDSNPHLRGYDDILSKLNKSSTKAEAQESRGLEERARSSKKLFYHRYIKNKDVSQYSAKDLECIFGKTEANTPQAESELTSTVTVSVSSKGVIEETSHGTTTINKGSMGDYFQKMMAKKGSNTSSDGGNSEDSSAVVKKRKHKGEVTEEIDEEIVCDRKKENEGSGDGRKKKKNKKSKRTGLEENPCEIQEEEICKTVQEVEVSEGKIKKKRKHLIEEESEFAENNGEIENVSGDRDAGRKNKIMKKHLDGDLDNDKNDDSSQKKKKKRKGEKNHVEPCEYNETSNEVLNVESSCEHGKKRKHRTENKNNENNSDEILNENNLVDSSKTKKRKKRRHEEEEQSEDNGEIKASKKNKHKSR